MVVLIAFHWSALLLYCLPPSYNFIFTTDHRFSIKSRSGLDIGHSIINSTINLSCSKNSRVSLDIYKGALSCLNIHFTTRLGLVPCKESLVHKIIVVSTVQFKSFNSEWSNNDLVDSSYHTTTSLLPSFSRK